jgi:hypothetical protein
MRFFPAGKIMALLPLVWVGFHDRLGRTPCPVYVSELRSTGTITAGTACVDVPFPADDKLLEVSAERFGVLWTSMSFFYADGGDRAVPLSCSYLEPERITEGVRRLCELVAETG